MKIIGETGITSIFPSLYALRSATGALFFTSVLYFGLLQTATFALFGGKTVAISKKELMEKFPKVENTMGAIEEVIDAVLADEFVPDTAVYIAITTLASKMDPKIPIEFYIDAIKECYSAKGWRVDYAGEVLIFI